MRIVGGQWRGRRLLAPSGRATRPTSDRVREAVFDVLQSLLLSGRLQPELRDDTVRAWPEGSGEPSEEPCGVLAGFTVLDLFAGSGAVGLEALSRGAACCTFVEAARPAVTALRRNLDALAVPQARARVIARQAGVALREEVAAGRRYTLLFADPPYADFAQHEGLLATSVPRLLGRGGLAIVETARRVEPHLPLTPLVSKLYGDTRVTFLAARRTDEGTGPGCAQGAPHAAGAQAIDVAQQEPAELSEAADREGRGACRTE